MPLWFSSRSLCCDSNPGWLREPLLWCVWLTSCIVRVLALMWHLTKCKWNSHKIRTGKGFKRPDQTNTGYNFWSSLDNIMTSSVSKHVRTSSVSKHLRALTFKHNVWHLKIRYQYASYNEFNIISLMLYILIILL